MVEPTSLVNQFLIAMPGLGDPNFSRTVTLICEHSREGAMGIVINRPLDIALSDILEQMNIAASSQELLQKPVYLGGPVHSNRGFVLHEPLGKWESTLAITDTIGVSTSRDILVAIAEERGPSQSFLVLGYASWGAGQLEREIAENAWLNCPSSREIIFDLPVQSRWQAAAGCLGIDLMRLSGQAGHA